MSFFGGILGGINQTNKTLTSIVTLSDGFITISGGNINNVNSLEVDNLEVGNLVVDTEASFNDFSANTANINVRLDAAEIYSPYSQISFISSDSISCTDGSFVNISADRAYVNDLFIANIDVTNANVSGNIFTNNIRSLGNNPVNIWGDLSVYGNISYIYSNIVRYADNNLQLNMGLSNVTAVGGGISVMGGNGNAVVSSLVLNSNLDWQFSSVNNQVNLGNLNSSNINNTGLLNSSSAIIGNQANYALFLNRSMGVANIGLEIRNSGLGNTFIQPQQQGVAYRNTYINPLGGVVAIGTTTPPSPSDKLYVNGIASISQNLNVTGNIIGSSNLTILGNADIGNLITSNITIQNLIASNANIGNLIASNGNIINFTSSNVTIDNMIVSNGNIVNLTSNIANINSIISNNANISNIYANSFNSINSYNDYVFTNRFVAYSCAINIVNASKINVNSASVKDISVNTANIQGIKFSGLQNNFFKIHYDTQTTTSGNATFTIVGIFSAIPVSTVSCVVTVNNMRPCWIYSQAYDALTNTVTIVARVVDGGNNPVNDVPINLIACGI